MDCTQTAVLWAATGRVDKYGVALVAAPIQIPVRWVTNRKEMIGPMETIIGLDAQAHVIQFVPNQSNIWLGTLADWLATGVNTVDNELMYVKDYQEGVDIKGRNTRRILNLMKYSDKLPT